MGGRFSILAWAVVFSALLIFALPLTAGAAGVLPDSAPKAVFHLTSFDDRSIPMAIGQGFVVAPGSAIVSVSTLEGAARVLVRLEDGGTVEVTEVQVVDEISGLARITLAAGVPLSYENIPVSGIPQAGEEVLFSDLNSHGRRTWVASQIMTIRSIPGLEGLHYLETGKPLPLPGGGVFGSEGNLLGMVILRFGNGSSGLLASGERLSMVAEKEEGKASLQRWVSQNKTRWYDSPYAKYMRGQVAFWQGRPEATLELMEDLLDTLPDVKAQLSALLGETYLAMGLLPEAILAYRCALEHGPGISTTYQKLAWAYMETGQYGLAERMCSQLIGGDPDDSYGYMLMARLRNLQGDYSLAIYEACRALMRDSDCSCAHMERGKGYIGLGSYDEAVASLKQATTLDPEFAEAFNDLGYAYLRAGKALNAIVVLKEAVELEPEMRDAWSNLGEAYARAGLSQKALAPLNQAVCLDPTHPFVYSRLAREFIDLGRYEEAEETIRGGLSRCEESQWLSFYLGKIFFLEGRTDLAREQVLQLQRENQALARHLQRLIDRGTL